VFGERAEYHVYIGQILAENRVMLIRGGRGRRGDGEGSTGSLASIPFMRRDIQSLEILAMNNFWVETKFLSCLVMS
jgi:hypothetical protein